MNWFAIKTLYRIFTQGKPENIDDDYDASASLVEERIILIQAKDIDAALTQAETDAKAYEVSYTNPYGQQVELKYLDVCDGFECEGEPGNGFEVYSGVRRVECNQTDAQLVELVMPPHPDEDGMAKRKKFMEG